MSYRRSIYRIGIINPFNTGTHFLPRVLGMTGRFY
ncbi:hypothetical protein E2C01_065256 [Portunus trituberculatus]|uniref:Uncharacterized protein n=1 Tax=Portunus trituberculatus TaxID=210409 RepID=A0A5B7HMI1_PORTR|nr:hypothetical protein [Portunus trituberculatus]